MLQEEELAVGNTRRARAEPPGMALIGGFRLDRVLILLPVHAIGRIGQHVVELAVPVRIIGKRIAEGDLFGVVARDQHIGLADAEGFAVELLPE